MVDGTRRAHTSAAKARRDHTSAGKASRPHIARGVGLAVAGAFGLGLAIALWIGIESSRLRVVVLLLASLCIAVFAVLLPTGWRARSALLVAAFVGAAGFLPTIAQQSPEPPRPQTQRKVNADYLAKLIREGPFGQNLPGPLEAADLRDVNISDPSASNRVDAVQLVIKNTASPGADFGDVRTFAWMETYPSPAAAKRRAGNAFSDAKQRYRGLGGSRGDPRGFSVVANQFWLCGGYRGNVYAEVDLAPFPNATEFLATGTVTAMLDYADRMTKLARSD